jgi:gamma-glutamylcyclotransferase (GGCT)/AIG2-like uncharacterized protein YtfP
VQALYHQTKRQISDEADLPSRREFEASIETFMTKIRNNTDLSESQRTSLLARLDSALGNDTVDGRSWEALKDFPSTVETSRAQYRAVLGQAAYSHGVSEEMVHEWVVRAREGNWQGSGSFVDYDDYPEKFRFDKVPGLPQDKATSTALRKLGYETFLAQPYPAFVYGTLRQGQGNNRVVAAGAERYAAGELKGIGIYGAGRGFPYAAEHDSENARTRGEIIWLTNNQAGQDARQGMDWLEGFNSNNPLASHYERRLHTATDIESGKPVDVWVYLARGSAKAQLQEHDRIQHGDWVKAREEYRDPSYIRSRLLGL